MLRRDFALALLSLPIARQAEGAAKLQKGPPLYVASRGRGKVFILGFGEAKDASWVTSDIRRAFESASDLWLEVNNAWGPDPEAAAKRERLTHDSGGRTFFEALDPELRERALAYCEKLGIKKEQIESQRPWSAFYVINGAYWSQHSVAYQPQYPDETLAKMAADAGKEIRYEMMDRLEFSRYMAAMSDAAQSQYIRFLLDFLDDQSAGESQGEFGWIEGDTSAGEKAVARMRTRTPDLYQYMQVDRNAWWTQTIDRLLTNGGSHFIGIGQMHTLGPDGIPTRLKRLENTRVRRL
ncbi:MAG: TraB/GumN family protein [Pseudomonadota bacterium]